MTSKSISSKWASMGLLSAITASLCCITPLLAMLAGSTGLATTFTWVEPFRPYLIGITILIIGFTWYHKLKPVSQEMIDCNCEMDEKAPFMQSKSFLGIVTVFAGFMVAFPYYSNVFYPSTEKTTLTISEEKPTQILVLDIEGMTCSGCEAHVEHAANEVQGIQKAKASFAKENAEISFDPDQTNPEEIIEAVKTTGYKIIDYKVLSTEKK